MKSTYRIIWSEEAFTGFKEIVSYLEKRFSERDVSKFIKKFDKQLDSIKSNPRTFPVSSGSKTVRRVIVAKLTSVYYSFDQDTIQLIAIHDNRKNPDNLKLSE
jgi:plasmid stabilization system protein ParE